MSDEFIAKYADVWGDDPRRLLQDYAYQPELTQRLDALDSAQFTTEQLYEIVLWKLNRFPRVRPELILELRTVGGIAPRHHREVDPALRELLQCPGVALPMASTILRFLNPDAFQIIDDRVYRIVFPGVAKYPAKPARFNDAYLDTSTSIYFDYLDRIHALASDALPFASADRILYELDIRLGNKIGDGA